MHPAARAVAGSLRPDPTGQVCRGFLCLWSRKPAAFGPADVEFLEVVASQLSVGLSSAEAQRTLHDVEAMRSEFVQTASHELRTPLTVMKGYADILTAGMVLDQYDTQQYLGRIREACSNLVGIVGSMVDIIQMDERAREVEFGPFDPMSIARRLAPQFKERYQGRTLALGEAGPVAVGDAGLAEKVVWHLLDNALKYSAPEDVPRIRVIAGDGFLRFEVFNRSEPFAADELSRLFRCFSRLPRHFALSGAGVGLFVSARFVERMGGKIGAENTADGVTFWFELPVLGTPRPEAPAFGSFQDPAHAPGRISRGSISPD